jgi:hypothetical protein
MGSVAAAVQFTFIDEVIVFKPYIGDSCSSCPNATAIERRCVRLGRIDDLANHFQMRDHCSGPT